MVNDSTLGVDMATAFTLTSTPPSPVHQVMMNDDLTRIIFDMTLGRGRFKHGYVQLCPAARCARVCRAFHEPAVAAVWHTLNDMTPLWHLLSRPKRGSYYHYRHHRLEKHLRSVSIVSVIVDVS